MTLILYHHNSSVCAAKVRVAFAEKNLEWESRLMRLNGDQFAPDYLRMNPAAVVPTLLHEGKAIAESNIILEYLEDAFPDHPLRPSTAFERAEARRLMMRLDEDASGIHHATSVVTYAIAYRHKLIERAGGLDREPLAGIIASSMNQKSSLWLKDAVFRGIRAPVFRRAIERLDTLFEEFEVRLSESGWLAGNKFSIVDVAYMPYMARFNLLQLDQLWKGRPAVLAWFGRLQSRDSFASIMNWYDPRNIEIQISRGTEVKEEVAKMLPGRVRE